MKKKLLSVLCVLALIAGVICLGSAVTAAEGVGALRVGYAIVNIDPADPSGQFRTIDYTSIYNDSGNASLKADIDAAVAAKDPRINMVKDASGKVTSVTYTVMPLKDEYNSGRITASDVRYPYMERVDLSTLPDGYFSMPLSGYGSTDSRLSVGTMDDNGDGKVDSKDGCRMTCIAITDAEGETMLFFTLDNISSDDFAAYSVRDGIRDALKAADASYDVANANMMFSSSHTHSSVDSGISNSYALNINAAQRAYEKLIVQRAKEAAIAAMADRSEAAVSAGEVEAPNMNAVRHYNGYEKKEGRYTERLEAEASWVYGDNFGWGLPSDKYVQNGTGTSTSALYRFTYSASNVSKSDETMYLYQFTPKNGKDPIVMVNFRAHPKLNSTSTLGYGVDNKFFNSPDYIGPLREKLEKYGYRACYIQGASGNQNTWNYLDDSVLTVGVTNTKESTAMYNEIMAYREPDGSTLSNYNDRQSFFKYTVKYTTPGYSPEAGDVINAQSGFSYGARLADYALKGLKNNMVEQPNGLITADQSFFTGDVQMYSKGLTAAAIEYKEVQKKTSGSLKYYYTDPDKTDGDESGYYNINSIYHANAVYGRRNANPDTYDCKLELNCITIGNLSFVSAPNELYDRYNYNGDQVNNNMWDTLNATAKANGYTAPMVLGYTNGSEGYVPNVAAYQYNQANNDKGEVVRPSSSSKGVFGVGAYEANTTKFAPGSGEKIIEHYMSAISGMKDVTRTSVCPMCGATNVQWNSLWNPNTTAVNGGHYYLSDDLVNYGGYTAYQRTVYKDSCIDLNGKIAGNGSTSTGRSFYIQPNVTARIYNGTIIGRGIKNGTNAGGGVIYADSGSTLYLTDVDVKREIYDGQSIAYGGAIYMNTNSKLYMKNGSISGGQAGTGGNLYLYTSTTADLDSVTLENGKATNKGDNICAWTNKIHIYGNSVLKGECFIDGGNSASVKFSGNVQAFESPDGENIKLSNNTRLTFGELSDTAKIAVQGAGCVTDTTGIQYAGKQLIASNGYYLDNTFTNRGVFVGDKWMCECGGLAADKHTCEYHAYSAWSTATSMPSVGNYYLTTDVTTSAQTSPNATYKILRIDLAGHSITHKVTTANANNTRVFSMPEGTTLALTDTVGNGTVKRDLSNLTDAQKSAVTNYGIGVCLVDNCTFRMYGGTMDMQGASTTGGGIVAGTTSKTLIEIYGGTLTGLKAGYGGGIFSKGTVKLAGGSITGNTAEGGAGVYVAESAAKLTLTGNANVTGNTNKSGAAKNITASSSQFTISGTYTGTAGITVSSPYVGKTVGTSNNANIAAANLTLDGVNGYTLAVSGDSLKVAKSGAPVIKDANGNEYTSIEQAILSAPAGTVFVLIDNVESDITLDKDVTIDLAGFSITGNITYNNGAKLCISDSNTADYTVEDGKGYGTVPASSNVVAAEKHLLHVENGVASAHAYDVLLTAVTLRTSASGIYYTSNFRGDEIVKGAVEEFGVSIAIRKVPDTAYILADTDYKTHTGIPAEKWVTGKNPNDFYGTVLAGILLPNNNEAFNKRNANVPIYGLPYIKLVGGEFLYGEAYCNTLREIIEQADQMTLTEDQLTGIVLMYAQYKTIMDEWNMPNIEAEYVRRYVNLTGTVTIEGEVAPDTVVTAKTDLIQTDADLVYQWSVDGKVVATTSDASFHIPVTAAGKNLSVAVKCADETQYSGNIESEAVVVGELSGTKMTFAGLYSDLKLLGRTAIDGTGLSTAWPGTGFSMNVKSNGTPLKLGVNVGTTSTYFCVEVDGVQVDRVRFLNSMEYTLNLPAGEHTVTFFRDCANTPKNVCKLEYIDFAGQILDKPANKELYIEVIGDSIASGLGSLGVYTPGTDWTNVEHSVSNSFGWYVAEDLDADISVIAKGGIGAVKEALEKNMLEIYPYVNGYTGTTPYDFSRKPDLVIVELGANDGSASTADYTANLTAMYQMILDNYGEDTKILWVGSNTRLHGIAAGMSDVFGDNCHALYYKYGVSGSGPNTGTPAHPDDEEHRAYADAIIEYIEEYNLMG